MIAETVINNEEMISLEEKNTDISKCIINENSDRYYCHN